MNTTTHTTTTSYHDRRLARRLEDPEYRAEFERATREIQVVDAIVNALDALRIDHGVSKAELARVVGKNPASVRRLFTTSGNPELRTVVAMADALDADVKIVPRRRPGRRGRTSNGTRYSAPSGGGRTSSTSRTTKQAA